MKNTKIIATYGPAIASVDLLRRAIAAGVNLFRVNCSHGDRPDFLEAARIVREAEQGRDFPMGLLFDISGPKLRLGRFEGAIPVRAGAELCLTRDRFDRARGVIPVNHPGILEWVKAGERLFVDDGKLIFTVADAGGDAVRIRALNGGEVTSAKGINLPDTRIDTPTLTEKDRADLATAVEAGADFVALSFVRRAEDVKEARAILTGHGGGQRVIAKLEKREAVNDLEAILAASDGVMVARGDLGVELPPEEVPNLQRRIIAAANRCRKPVIVATQMLESMRFEPRATRAEINDVASAVYDLADAVMLSAETATGRYPIEAVETMGRVIEAAERVETEPPIPAERVDAPSDLPLAVAGAVIEAQRKARACLIFAYTSSGFTAELISNHFPSRPVVALVPDATTQRRLTLCRSVYPVIAHPAPSFEAMLSEVEAVCARYRLADPGDRVVITGGVPFGASRPTNMMMIHEIGRLPPA